MISPLTHTEGAAEHRSARAAFGFGPENTVMIDDTARKMREFPDNVVVVPSFDERDVGGPDDVLEFHCRLLEPRKQSGSAAVQTVQVRATAAKRKAGAEALAAGILGQRRHRCQSNSPASGHLCEDLIRSP